MKKRFVSILLALMLTLAMALPVMAGGAANDITLQATSGPDSVSLSWTPAANTNGLNGYYVYRSTQPGSASGTPANDFWETTTTFTDRNVENGKTYYYTVRPVYGQTVGTPSNEVKVTVGSNVTIIMTIGNPQMLVNGVAQLIDPPSGQAVPLLRNNRTFVPIRAVVESLGGTVAYDASTRMVTIIADQKTINLWIDSKIIKVNGLEKAMDVAPFLEASRTYLPLRFILENLNCTTDWNGNLQQVTIKRGFASLPVIPGNGSPVTPGSVTPGTGFNPPGVGNTGSTDKPVFEPKPPVISGPPVIGTLEPPKQLLNWGGRWDTSFGILVLTQPQNSNEVTGTYPEGTLTGSAAKNAAGNNILTGTFDEGGGYTGPFTFTMSANGNSFTGTWHYDGDSETREWSGTRMAN